MAAFSELGVMPEITTALERMDWSLPTEIQAEAIPLILGGGDVVMASETGTGKTGAFCIPVVQIVYEHVLASQSESQSKEPAYNIQKKPWSLSPIDRATDLVLSKDLLTAQSKSGNWQGVRATKGVKRSKNGPNAKIYYEVNFADQGLARAGWSFADASLDLGTDKSSWGYGGTAKKSNNKQFTDYGTKFGEKFDIVGCILDMQTGDMSFTVNGRNLGVAFKIPTRLLDYQEIYPTVCVKNAGCQVHLGQQEGYNDYKRDNFTWISDVDHRLVVEGPAEMDVDIDELKPLAIILEPSRELARQTFDCIRLFSKDLRIDSALLIGGGGDVVKNTGEQPHIIVCTPGKLSEVVTKNRVPLKGVHFFILDEADGLLQQGQRNLIHSVHRKLPKMFSSGRRLQTVCCSATLHNFAVKKLAQELMYSPIWIDLKGEDSVPDTVHHVFFKVNPKTDNIYRNLKGLFATDGVHDNDKVHLALFERHETLSRPEELSEAIKLMKFHYTIKAIEALNMDQGIIFCRTKLDCDNLFEFMQTRSVKSDKYSCVRLHSSLSQEERDGNLNKFKRSEVKFLICTDVAARGIDVKGIPFVIQVTLPDEKANYIHRIGRVGRAERMGLAVSLVGTEQEKVWYHSCNRRDCRDTRLTKRGGCCKWFSELDMLNEIEHHLKCTVQEIGSDFKLQVDDYDGKVVYGAKKLEQTYTYKDHVEQLKSIVSNLKELETEAQSNYLTLYM